MGLAVVGGIVEQSQGTLHFTSASGEGTTFVLELPGFDGAEEAMALLEAGTPVELLVTDVVMPGMSGRALSEKVGALSEKVGALSEKVGALSEKVSALRPSLPVLFTTGYTDDEVMLGAFRREAMVVQKPYTVTHLVERMRERLDRPGGT